MEIPQEFLVCEDFTLGDTRKWVTSIDMLEAYTQRLANCAFYSDKIEEFQERERKKLLP